MMASLQKIKKNLSRARDDFHGFHNNMSSDDNLLFGDGVYIANIKRWLHVFSPDRFLIIDGEEIFKDPGPVIEQLQDFLPIPKLLLRKDFVRHPKTGLYCLRPWWNSTYDFSAEYRQDPTWGDGLYCLVKSKGKTRSHNAAYPFPQHLKITLQKFYQPYNDMLYKLLGRKFLWQW